MGELMRIADRFELLERQLASIDLDMKEQVTKSRTPAMRKTRDLLKLRGVGPITARTLAFEFFGWRDFKNRKQVGALAGLTAVPRESDGIRGQQGISKAGNRRVRTLMIQLAWGWLRHQPNSPLTKWFEARWAQGSRNRRRGIVAVARKLLVALWRYVDQGIVPEGAVMS